MADYCVINDNCNISTGNITWYETGNATFNATIQAKNMDAPPSNSILWIDILARLFIG